MTDKPADSHTRGDSFSENPRLDDTFIQPVSDADMTASLLEPVAPPPTGDATVGLHIRCPHCSNDVQLLASTPFEEISCRSCGSNFNLCERESPSRKPFASQRIDRFELVSRLGMGGFGAVWKARDAELDRMVALKLPRKGQLSDYDVEQFFREARAAAQLHHPNIVPIHEVGRHEDAIFIVSDLVRGATLSEWLLDNSPTPKEAVKICLPITRALAHAHQQGVIHRDLKPSNIMLGEDGHPFLMDFGLAKREFGEVTMTMDGQVLGTPSYMSPEQADGKSKWIDRRTDIYSMGVMLFEMVAGELPFRGNVQMQIQQRINDDPPSPRKLNRHIPADIETMCLKCLERDPNKRYQSAEELAEDFERFLQGRPINARPLSAVARCARWAQRKPALATVAALITLLAIAGPATALVINGQRQRLAQLVVEKDNLIGRYADDSKTHLAKLSQLSGELDVWQGKANPWDLWPPRAVSPPRKDLLNKLYEQNFAAWVSMVEADQSADQAKASGHLGLGMLAQEAGHLAEAAKHLRLAKEIYTAQLAGDSTSQADLEGLRECLYRLAQVQASTHPKKARQLLSEAAEVSATLSENNPSAVQFQADQMDAELRSAVHAGFEKATANLAKAKQLSEAILNHQPRNSAEIYQLINHLAGTAAAEPAK